LGDQEGASDPDRPSQSPRPSRLLWSVEYVKRYLKKRRSEKNKQSAVDRAAASTARATWAIAVLTAVTIGVGISQYFIFNNQLDATKDEFAFTHRPHIRLRFTVVKHEGDKFFKAGKLLEGTIDVLNNGQTDASIIDSDIEVYWSKIGLPTCFPGYCEKTMAPNHFVCGHGPGGGQAPCTIIPGGNINAPFQSSKPMPDFADQIEAGRNGWKLYLVGWIQYRGSQDTHARNFDFALIFKPQTHRFFPVTDDPDYVYDPDKN
jgi:hypothetical protein